MKKSFVFFISFLFFISLSSAVSLKLSPPQIDFVAYPNQKICHNVSIKVDSPVELEGKILWAKEGVTERKLSLHNLTSDKLKIDTDFKQNIFVDKNKTIEICINSKKRGNYHGALLYKIKNAPAQVGIWISINTTDDSLIKITGNSVNTMDTNLTNTIIYLPIALLIILLLLIIIKKQKKPCKKITEFLDEDEKLFDSLE